MKKAILPGATIGVLGGGQLGRMFAIAARKMGYRVHTLSPEDDTPTGQVADVEMNAAYEDVEAVKAFARRVDVVTFEFENVAYASTLVAADYAPVRPDGKVLHTTQHRLREKTFLAHHGFPVTPFRAIHSLDDLKRAIEEIGCPCVLKSAGFGYDGKGQEKILVPERAWRAWQNMPAPEAVLEKFVDFACELSVIGARGLDGAFVHYGPVENRHRNHILDVTTAPAAVSEKTAREAVEIARGVLEALDVVGVLCVEYFLTRDGKLLINELAPRPHNSGHYTFDACVTSQFEQQLRAICGLPLGSVEQWRPAAMANLLGDLWEQGEPDWRAACAHPGVKLHVYGKAEARPGRKMGHLTAMAASAEQAREEVLAARRALTARR